MNATSSSTPDASSRAAERALVLGGGGAAGNAWLIGVVAGLYDAGLDVTGADVVVGTSAGATAAAMITTARPPELLARILEPALAPRPGNGRSVGGPGGRPASPPSQTDHLGRLQAIIDAAQDPPDLARRIAATSRGAEATPEGSARWRRTVAARLPSQDWPDRPVLITAIDAETGEPVVFDRHGDVELVDAVAASCSNGLGIPPYPIHGRRYLDGGYRTSENADLAAGYGRVLVLSPLGGRSLTPPHWGMYLDTHVDDLRAHGSRVETILPDTASLAAFGDNMMDLSARAPAARAGCAQGRALAPALTGFWS